MYVCIFLQEPQNYVSHLGTVGGLIPAFGGSMAPPVKNLMGARNNVPSKSKIDSHLRAFFPAVGVLVASFFFG
jgi:hypothetical protein